MEGELEPAHRGGGARWEEEEEDERAMKVVAAAAWLQQQRMRGLGSATQPHPPTRLGSRALWCSSSPFTHSITHAAARALPKQSTATHPSR